MKGPAYNSSLHGLRGLAVLLVVIYHIHRAVITAGFGYVPDTSGLVYRLLESGCQGVELFFLISGYLIFGSLRNGQGPVRFLLNRAIRIYPAFLVPHLLVFCLGPVLGYAWLGTLDDPLAWCLHFLSNLLFLPGVFPLPIAQIVAWSLSYEFLFYLLSASGLILWNRRGRGMFQWLPAIAWLAAVGSFLVLHPRAWFFVAGISVQLITVRSAESGAVPDRFGRWQIVVESVACISGLVTLLWFFDLHIPVSLFGGTVALFLVARDGESVRRLFGSRPLAYLGTISYSLYLWHVFVLFAVKRLLVTAVANGLSVNAAVICCTMLGLGGSVVIAHLSWLCCERHLGRWLRRRADFVHSKAPDWNRMTGMLGETAVG